LEAIMDILARPLSRALGAEITGIDLASAPEAAELQFIFEAWAKYLVLVFPGQQLTDQQLVAFSRNFGDLDLAPLAEVGSAYGAHVPSMPEVTVISNVIVDAKAIGALGAGEAEWHTDMSYCEVPPSASLLYALEIPPAGGDTSFLNMYTAYETLPHALRQQIANRRAIHDATYTSAGGLRTGVQPVDDVRMAPGARHSLLRVHPLTRRTALFLGRRRNSYIIGLPVEESERILDLLWAHATQPAFAFTHRWKVGDLVMWDNRCAMHRRDAFDPDSRRIMHRTQVKGEVPISAAELAA
jgi:taurine dioxygenase